ncbi:protein kintoun isoform X3 [Sturnira hondurensis]|uniref:protein kintoun isoform X3 n=1 Tax=Sturnira hondurensis TaxID=192404 RepID=UPI001879EB2B|nr:protein kintoun isoform X3 [Sturnira hondurensis]
MNAATGSQWSLPYSLAPGREYAGRRGTRYMVYDVVFHPGALALARRHERFRQMLDSTALEVVEKQFGVKLDHRNAKMLKIKYKGTPEAAVLRTPLPGGVPSRPEGELESPLPDFPYPYRCLAASGNFVGPERQAPSSPEAVPQPAPTEPHYSVVQRHHVDLQDYRCSRDSAPSPVPQELVVTIELPLLRSAEQAALEVTGKLLCLDSKKPDYQLRLSLPYPVDDSHGKAQFNKTRRQLVVTLPVAQSAVRREPATETEDSAGPPGTDGAACTSAGDGQTDPAGDRVGGQDVSPGRAGAADAGITTPDIVGEELFSELEERDFGGQVVSDTDFREKIDPGTGSSPGDCGGIAPCISAGLLESSAGRRSACGDLSVTRVAREDTGWESSDPAMDGPGTGSGEPLCPPLQCKQDEESLTLLIQERLFINEENVNEFLEDVLSSPFQQTTPLTPPLIEVLQVTDSKIQIQAKLQKCSNSEQLQEKEERADEGSHLTEKEKIEHPTTSTMDSDSSIAVEVLEIDSCGSAEYLQQESLDVSPVLFGKSQQPESKMEPEFMKEKSAVYSNEGKDNLKGPVMSEKKELTVHNISGFDNIKETNMQDGSVQIIKDHVTHCAFSFQNSLLYDLD